jgi:hypothetical protein
MSMERFRVDTSEGLNIIEAIPSCVSVHEKCCSESDVVMMCDLIRDFESI